MPENGTVITIGTFDGVHLGHQFLINKTIEIAKTENLNSLVLTFNPHPRSYLNPDYQPLVLTELPKKIELIKKLGIDDITVLEFNQKIAELEAIDFVTQILIQKYNLKHLIIGHDFALGKGRKGDYNYLKKLAKQLDFKITHIPQLEIYDTKPSSGLIRNLLVKGDIEQANKLLGWEYNQSKRL